VKFNFTTIRPKEDSIKVNLVLGTSLPRLVDILLVDHFVSRNKFHISIWFNYIH
jgi:hypothetical protein